MPGGTEVRMLREEAVLIAQAKGTTPPPAPGDANRTSGVSNATFQSGQQVRRR